jgi:hypothetical protein
MECYHLPVLLKKMKRVPRCTYCEWLIDEGEEDVCYVCSLDHVFCRGCLSACEQCENKACHGCGSVNICSTCNVRLCKECMSMGGQCTGCMSQYYCDDCLSSEQLCELCKQNEKSCSSNSSKTPKSFLG